MTRDNVTVAQQLASFLCSLLLL